MTAASRTRTDRQPSCDACVPNQDLMHTRLLVLTMLVLGFAACGDLRVRSVPPSRTLPVTLQGRWLGSWQSEISLLSGNVEIFIQEFAGEPLVRVNLDNPCLVPRDYELVVTGDTLSLKADGVVVLEASMNAPQQLEGTYACAEDQGTWIAQWVEALPEPLDLTGTWSGRIFGGGEPDQAIELVLEQRVAAGTLVLSGDAQLPDVSPMLLPVTGYVEFREDRFELVLQTQQGLDPRIILSGSGDREPLQLPDGLLQVLSQNALSYSQAMVELVRQD
jgi:hypothetical protein